MNISLSLIVVLFASLLAGAGCKKSDKDKAADKPAEKVAPGPAAPAAGCSDKAFKHTNPSFCVDVPDGYDVSAEKKDVTGSTEITLTRKADKEEFVISWGRADLSVEDSIRQNKNTEKNEKMVEQADLPGGGHFAKKVANDETTDNKDFYILQCVVKGTKAYVELFAQNFKTDFIDDAMKTCKAIHVE
jgi:hypothetical protein